MNNESKAYKLEMIKQKLVAIYSKVNENLLANPKFNSSLSSACESLIGGIEGQTYDYNIQVSEDGKTVTVSAKGYAPQMREELNNNIAVTATTISLGDNNDMVIDRARGVIFNANALRSIGEQLDSRVSGTLSTQYDHTVIDYDGIEMSRSQFLDSNYKLEGELNYGNLYDQVFSLHRPTFSSTNAPVRPNLCNNGSSQCVYRDYNNLGMVNVLGQGNIRNGQNPVNDYSIYSVSAERPDRLNYSSTNPVARYDDVKREMVVVNNNYSQDMVQAQEEIKNDFVNNLENSKTKEFDPEIYEAMVAHSKTGRSL